MRKLWALLLLLVPALGMAQTDALNGWCDLGSTSAQVQGLNSTNKLQGSIPQCTVTVYLTGTTTKATIFADSIGTPLANPFTAGTKAQWLFWAATGVGYDVTLSGGVPPLTYPSPVTFTDLKVGGSGGGGSQTIISVNGTPTVPVSPVNFQNSGTVTWNFSGGNITATSSPPGSGVTIEHNGTAVPTQNILDFNDTNPAAPAGGQQITFLNNNTGQISAYFLPTGGLRPFVQGPIPGQFAIIYPTTGTITNEQNILLPPSTIGPSSAQLNYTCPNTLCSPGATTAVFSGFSLPSYISAGSVTAVYGFHISAATASGPMVNPQIACTGITAIPPLTFGWQLQEGTGLLTGINGSNIGTVSCNTVQHGSVFGDKRSQWNISAVGLLVYYTGTPPPTDNRTQVVEPLYYNAEQNTLGFDLQYLGYLTLHQINGTLIQNLPPASIYPGTGYLINNGTSATDCSTGGGSFTVLCTSNGTTWSAYSGSGGGGSTPWSSITNPVATESLSMGNSNTTTFTVGSATAANNMFVWTDTATNNSATGILGRFTTTPSSTMIPWQADANGNGFQLDTTGSLKSIGSTSHGMTIPAGTAVSGAASAVIYASDSTNGYGEINENNTGLSRICTAANGICASASPSTVCQPGSFAAQTDGATVTWAIGSSICANASLTFTTHGGSRTLNLTGLVNGGSYVMWLKQDSTGGEGLTLGSGCTWKVGGGGLGAITPSTGANAIDVLAFMFDGTNCYANFRTAFN
jgi:hypothetical protein